MVIRAMTFRQLFSLFRTENHQQFVSIAVTTQEACSVHSEQDEEKKKKEWEKQKEENEEKKKTQIF